VYAGRRHPLLLSAETSSAGVLLTEAKLRRGVEAPTPLHLLLLKYVRGARLVAIAQPPLERVLRFTFEGEYGSFDLVCETMGRYSNIILLDQSGAIMDSIKRVPSSINRYRTILPRQPYVPPPTQNKQDPRLLTATDLRLALEKHADVPLWRQLVNAVSAISPLLAKEIVYRAFGATLPTMPLGQEDSSVLVRALEGLFALPHTHAWTPCLAYGGEGEERHPIAYAPYDLTHLRDREPMLGISEAILRFLEARDSYDPYRGVRERLHGLVAEQKERQQARLASLRRSLVPEEEIEGIKMRANAILAMAWAIQPGQRELVVDPSEVGAPAQLAGEKLVIPLDPRLTPAQNAQELFQSYHKMKAAAEGGPQRIVESEQELAYLEQLDVEIDLAEDRPQLDEVEMAMREAGYQPPEKGQRSAPRSQPLRHYAPDGSLILVGRNSAQNEQVTFKLAGPVDTWLHAHGAPGAHVLIKNGGQPLDEGTLLMAARLAARYSAARREGIVQVDFTARRHVRHIKGARPGMVTYSHERTVQVDPQDVEGEDDA
jgi:predicted ribosome quality control (RQC) complex YloA/Tae2 family protein